MLSVTKTFRYSQSIAIIFNLQIWQTLDSLHTDHTKDQIIHSGQTEHKYEPVVYHPTVICTYLCTCTYMGNSIHDCPSNNYTLVYTFKLSSSVVYV